MNANADLWANDTSLGRDLAFKSWQYNVGGDHLAVNYRIVDVELGRRRAAERIVFAGRKPSIGPSFWGNPFCGLRRNPANWGTWGTLPTHLRASARISGTVDRS